MVYVAGKLEKAGSDSADEYFQALLQAVEKAHLSSTYLRKAYQLAKHAHAGQFRFSGEEYIFHPLAVAEILIILRMDSTSLVVALLHDVVEDTLVSLDDIEKEFGVEVRQLVHGVTKMRSVGHEAEKNLQQENTEEQKKEADRHLHLENLRNLLLAMAQDIRVVMIKLADRLHNMRTLKALSRDKQRNIARETLDIYAPLANRLGIWQIKWELEDLSFRYLYPDKYHEIAKNLDERRVDRAEYIDNILVLLRSELSKKNIKADVTGRPKHIYSIWKKMQQKKLQFHELYDLRAVRIMLDNIADCYHALGIVHTLWSHIPREFDDYIATPKENNYQSIHTAVIGPQGKVLEIQIRTYDMHEHAEFGVAAHWRYKEGTKAKGSKDKDYEQKITWLRQLLQWQDEEVDAEDFIDRFKSEVFQDRVYVLTPQGEVIDLPKGATVLDFAFYVHTDVGSHCRGAKVNGRIVPLNYELQSGEQVNILTAKHIIPSRDWLNPQLGYLKTSRARAKARQWFKKQDYDKNLLEGREILEKELQRLGVNQDNVNVLCEKFSRGDKDTLYIAIGRGEISSGQIASALQNLMRKTPTEKIYRKAVTENPSNQITIAGIDNVLSQIAQCCKPVPGDHIVGFISKGRGVVIHNQNCKNIQSLQEENDSRLVEVAWRDDHNIHYYEVDIEVIAVDRQGLLRDISTVLSNLKINVSAVHTRNGENYLAYMRLTMDIYSIEQLSSVLNRLVQIRNVVEAYRVTE